eukprot:TRINITY_DN586_c0_g1_i1.p1 TRINITY_DN586_c0_g1~~TRINITY_DN586_c0_g1_i1.p1  ORF type:complete len:294 (-),score=64.76 TRINITY_DN586_c0_g1_i1:92-973(-)
MNSIINASPHNNLSTNKYSNSFQISSIFQFDLDFGKKFKQEIFEIQTNMNDTFRPISNETAIKLEIIADVIANTVNGIYELDIPEERIKSLTKDIEQYMLKEGEKIVTKSKKEFALKSICNVNYKIFIPMLPKLAFGTYEYQLRPLFPNYENNNVDQPYILIKSYKPKQRENNELNEYKDCSGCDPTVVQYCKNCGRVLVDGKHPNKSYSEDHFGSPPNTINLRRELIHLLYTDIYPYVFFTTFICSLLGVGGFWGSTEEKMAYFIGSIANKFIQFKDNLSEELQKLLGFKSN